MPRHDGHTKRRSRGQRRRDHQRFDRWLKKPRRRRPETQHR